MVFFLNFDSFTSKCNKRSLIDTLLYRAYTGKSSLDLRARLRRTIEKNVPFSKLNVVFRSTWLLITEKFVPTFLARASGYMGTSNLTGKRLKKAKKTAVFDHLL